jgi:hypothetical protein
MGRDAKDDCHGALSKIPDPITQAIFATIEFAMFEVPLHSGEDPVSGGPLHSST